MLCCLSLYFKDIDFLPQHLHFQQIIVNVIYKKSLIFPQLVDQLTTWSFLCSIIPIISNVNM